MKITFVLPGVTLNGGIRVVAIYAEWLKRRGHEVDVIAPPLRISLQRKVKFLFLGCGWPSGRLDSSYFDGTGVMPRILERYRPVADSDVRDADVIVATFYDTAHWVSGFPSAKGAKAIFIQKL